MCGIAGIIALNRTSAIEIKEIEMIFQAIRHRGTDAKGFFLSDAHEWHLTSTEIKPLIFKPIVALVHARLSVIDLTPHANQPMCREHICLLHNGEIYNFLKLRKKLESDFDFRSESDTEVILAGILRWGLNFYKKANGMWADAIWDKRKRTLYLLRDRLGIKPLYYSIYRDRFVFASEIKAILALLNELRALNVRAAFEFLNFHWIDHSEETLVKGIFQVPPGSVVSIDLDGNIKIGRLLELKAKEETIDEPHNFLRELLDESVKLRLVSDVPVGVLLSGGVDSSGIAAIASKYKTDIAAFTVTYPEKDRELRTEFSQAKRIAKEFGLKHYAISLTPGYFAHLLRTYVHRIDLPFFSASMFAEYAIIKFARLMGVKVVLSGQGADELFAGYPPYWATKLASLASSGRWNAFFKTLRAVKTDKKLQILSLSLLPLMPHSVRKAFLLRTFPLMKDFFKYQPNFKDELESSLETHVRYRGIRDLNMRLMLDTTKYHLPALLRFIDRNSMAHSVEARVPFLDHRIVEFAFGLDSDWKMRNGFTKFVLRKALDGLIPDEIRLSKAKFGFPTPLFRWMTGSLQIWIEDRLRKTDMLDRFFAYDTVSALWRGFVKSGKHGDLIWRIFSLDLWMQEFNITIP